MAKRLLILIFTCLIGGSVFGAKYSDTLKLYHPSCVKNITNDTLEISSAVNITGNSDTLSGYIYLNVMINGDTVVQNDTVKSAYSSYVIDGNGYGYEAVNVHVPFITKVLSISVSSKLPILKNTGNNIVVVWPTGGSNITNTKIVQGIDTTFNISLTGIAPLVNYDNFVKFYPNPFTDWIRIQKMNPDLVISQITVSDVNGKALIVKNEDIDFLSLPNLPKGVYFLNINYTDGNTSRFKLIGL